MLAGSSAETYTWGKWIITLACATSPTCPWHLNTMHVPKKPVRACQGGRFPQTCPYVIFLIFGVLNNRLWRFSSAMQNIDVVTSVGVVVTRIVRRFHSNHSVKEWKRSGGKDRTRTVTRAPKEWLFRTDVHNLKIPAIWKEYFKYVVWRRSIRNAC